MHHHITHIHTHTFIEIDMRFSLRTLILEPITSYLYAAPFRYMDVTLVSYRIDWLPSEEGRPWIPRCRSAMNRRKWEWERTRVWKLHFEAMNYSVFCSGCCCCCNFEIFETKKSALHIESIRLSLGKQPAHILHTTFSVHTLYENSYMGMAENVFQFRSIKSAVWSTLCL